MKNVWSRVGMLTLVRENLVVESLEVHVCFTLNLVVERLDVERKKGKEENRGRGKRKDWREDSDL